jgi:hypothetical protein
MDSCLGQRPLVWTARLGNSFLSNSVLPAAVIYSFFRVRPRIQPISGIHNPFPAAVISSTCNPVYAKQKLSPLRSRGSLFLCLALAFFLATFPQSSRADSLEDAARALARKVCTAPRPQSTKVNWQASSELSVALSDSLKKMFISELSSCGMATDSKAEFPVLNIVIRGNTSKLLFVADFVDPGAGRQIRMTEIRREALSVANSSSRTLLIQKKLLWQQETPLESAMEWYGPSTQERFLFLVNQGSIMRLRSANEVWTQVDSTELPKADRPSRGGERSTFMYGNLGPEAKLEVLINRKICEFSPAGNLSLICKDSYLGGKQLRLLSDCGNMEWSLWTDNGDYVQKDRIFCGRVGAAEPDLAADESTSHSMEMPGPVLDVSTTQDFRAAIAVVKNLATGNYEVYRITLACTN